MRFTKQSIESLSVPPGRPYAFFRDETLPGFGIKLNAGGSRQWIVDFRNPAGQPKRVTIGRVDTISLDDARKHARKVLAEVQLGADPHAAKAEAKAKAAITLKSTIELYLPKAEERQKPRSYLETRRHLNGHWSPLHDRPLHKLKLVDVAERLDAITVSSGKIAANRARSALSALFSFAIQRGLAEANPVIASAKATEETSRSHLLTDDELVAIWKACRDDHHGRAVRLLILTAQRRDEVGGMCWSEIDRAEASWTIAAARMKNSRLHLVPLAREAMNILAAITPLEGRDFVFGLRKGPFSGWSKCKRELDKRAGVTDWRLHDLRRTVATRLADTGTLPHVVEAILSHVSGHKAGVAGIYNRASYLPEKRAALDGWAERVRALVDASETEKT